MQSTKLRSSRMLTLVIGLAIAPACCAQNASTTSRLPAVLTLSQIIVDPPKPTDWNDPQWKIREVPNPGCNGGYRTSDHDISVQELAGHTVKAIHVTAYRLNANAPSKERKDLRQQVLDVWLGQFRAAFCQIAWAEMSNWSINATVEFDDGKRGSLLTDGSHVRLLGHDGKFWFLRLLPAAQ